MNLLQRFIGFISQPDHRRTFSILAALAILAAIPLTVYIAQQQQDIRQRAEGSCPPGYEIGTVLPANIPGCFPICQSGQHWDALNGCISNPTPTPGSGGTQPTPTPPSLCDAQPWLPECQSPPPIPPPVCDGLVCEPGEEITCPSDCQTSPPPVGGGVNYCTAAGFHECTPGTSAGSCTKDGKTCTAYEVYTCNFGGKNYCGSTSCAEPCTGGGTKPPPGGGGIGNDGPGGCCNPSAPNDGSGDNCRSWERCDIANGACSTGKSCRSTTGCARDSDCGPGNRCQGGTCQPGPSTGQCQSAETLQARFQLNSSDSWGQTKQVRAATPVNVAVFRNNEGALAGSKVNNEYTPTDVSGRISGPANQSIDVSKVNQFTPTQAGTYTLTATCGNNVTGTATLTVTGGNNPKAYLDGANCNNIEGWACDIDNYSTALEIHFYKDGQVGSGGTFIGSILADKQREEGVGSECGGNRNHGFSFNTPAAVKDNTAHSIYAYAINILQGTSNPLLYNSPKTITCTATTPTPTTIARLSADVNNDGCVSILDFNEWLYAFKNNGTPRNTNHRPDINNDGKVDIIDFNLWLRALQSGQNLCQ